MYFLQATGRGGQAVQGHDVSKVETMEPVKDRVIRVRFNADTASSMQWNFRPQQTEVRVSGNVLLAELLTLYVPHFAEGT